MLPDGGAPMLESMFLMAIGAGLARVGLWPIMEAVNRRQVRLDAATAARIAQAVRDDAARRSDGAVA